MLPAPQPSKAGPLTGLPFLLLVGAVLLSGVYLRAEEKLPFIFQEFESSCIDLGHHDKTTRTLTVRFVNQNTNRFYRYSNVPTEIWKKLKALNETGGVGSYLNDTVVQHPEKYHFVEIRVQSFKVISGKKKAGDSK